MKVESVGAFISLAYVACSRSMRSRHKCAGVLLIGLLSVVSETEASTKIFKSSLTTKNPCSDEKITIHGTTVLSINKTFTKVFVYEHFFGEEKGYSTNFYGRGEFDKTEKSYEIKLNGDFDSDIGSFVSKAVDEISSTNGTTPSSDKFKSMNNVCNNK